MIVMAHFVALHHTLQKTLCLLFSASKGWVMFRISPTVYVCKGLQYKAVVYLTELAFSSLDIYNGTLNRKSAHSRHLPESQTEFA